MTASQIPAYQPMRPAVQALPRVPARGPRSRELAELSSKWLAALARYRQLTFDHGRAGSALDQAQEAARDAYGLEEEGKLDGQAPDAAANDQVEQAVAVAARAQDAAAQRARGCLPVLQRLEREMDVYAQPRRRDRSGADPHAGVRGEAAAGRGRGYRKRL